MPVYAATQTPAGEGGRVSIVSANTLTRFKDVRPTGDNQWSARCEAHDDNTSSLSLSIGEDGRLLVYCHAGCPTEKVVAAAGLTMKDLMPRAHSGNGHSRITAEYGYHDADGALIYQAVRREPGKNGAKKDFTQRRPDGSGGWIWKLNGVTRVPYRLPELLSADKSQIVFIVEGEKDVDNCRSRGLTATCNVGGAGKWNKSLSKYLKGRRVVILPDNDSPGREHAAKVSRLLNDVAADVRILELPGLPEKGDVSDWLADGHDTDELLKLAESAPNAADKPKPNSGLPLITLGLDETRVIDESLDALGQVDGIYQRGGMLVHIVRDTKPPRGITRSGNAPRIVPMPDPRLKELLSGAAVFAKGGETDGEIVPAPFGIVKAIVARGQWPTIPAIDAVVEVPVLRPDGSILSTPGFDRDTGIFYSPPRGGFPPIAAAPASTDITEAAELLLGIIRDFPFKDAAHQAAAVAGMLTPFARFAYDGPTPLTLIDGNAPGVGKGLLADVITHPFAGRSLARMSQPRGDEEMRKRIGAIALAGELQVLIDNINGPLGCSSLDAALTATTWNDRVLGRSEMTGEVPLLAAWFATANNAILAGDTLRRTVHVRLETDLERPEERTGFTHPDLLGWLQKSRGEVVKAILTILRGYFAAGAPDQKLPPWGSFEGWSGVVRNAVVWAGLCDPGETRTELREQGDQATQVLRLLIDGWCEVDPGRLGITVSEALRRITDMDNRAASSAVPFDYPCPTMRNALIELGKDGRYASAKSLGMKLHHLRGRIIGGKFFDRVNKERTGALWVIRETSSL